MITLPFRVGRKQKRVILDANGIEIAIFHVGQEDIAKMACDLLNQALILPKNKD